MYNIVELAAIISMSESRLRHFPVKLAYVQVQNNNIQAVGLLSNVVSSNERVPCVVTSKN